MCFSKGKIEITQKKNKDIWYKCGVEKLKSPKFLQYKKKKREEEN